MNETTVHVHLLPWSLVRSTDVFAHITEELRTAPIEWLRASAYSVARREDGTHEVVTDGGACRLGVRQRAGCRACLYDGTT
jgi:hypothetical protein